jgi:hypothetical protein
MTNTTQEGTNETGAAEERKRTLHEEFEMQAEWRRGIAEKYPGDSRNLEAAKIFDRLAATAHLVPEDVVEAYWELFEDFGEAETHSERLRLVGFHYFPEDAEAFVRDGCRH